MDLNDEFDSNNESVLIDCNSADLNLIIDKECLLAYPISSEGFCSMWAGCRANYGVNSGKVAFEINLEDYCECIELPKDDPDPYMIRVGWSPCQFSLQIGETKNSYAYCNNGKICTENNFEEFGESFEKGDSVASYIDYETDPENILFSFSKNGIDLGIAFKVAKKDTDFLFFPHVLSKNIVFEMNFGQRVSLIGDEPFAPIKSDFLLIQKIPIEKRFSFEYAENENAQVLLLVGLPGAGKTDWATEYAINNLKKSFYIIGVTTILEKMKAFSKKRNVSDESKKSTTTSGSAVANDSEKNSKNAKNDESVLPQKAALKIQTETHEKVLKCMNILMDIAAQSNRNIILDQPNIYVSTRRRKMKLFEKFKRHCKVLMISEDAYNQVVLKYDFNEKDSCISIIDNMKANMSLPKESDNYFDSIEYVKLNEEESKILVEKNNKEGSQNRLDSINKKRLKKFQATSKQNAVKFPNQNLSSSFQKNNPRMMYGHAPYSTQPGYTNFNEINRFNSNITNLNNRRFLNPNYYNQNVRFQQRFQNVMNPSLSYPLTYQRPILNNFNMMQPVNLATPAYHNVNQQWPAATSTAQISSEIWNWAPALPISNPNQHPNLQYSEQSSIPLNLANDSRRQVYNPPNQK